MIKCPWILIGLSASVLLSHAHAQDRADRKETPRQEVIRVFEATSPSIGDRLPELECLDESGKPFSFSQLKGRPAVLLFGCLT